MNETLKKWINALRSGEYKQAKGILCDDNGGYCCLGVLEHLLTGGVERESHASWDPGRAEAMISKEFAIEHGFDRENMFDTGLPCYYLAEINDDGMSFEDIADRLEGKA